MNKAFEGSTYTFNATLGFTPGYHHENQQTMAINGVAQDWQMLAEDVERETGVYVSAVLSEAVVAYSTEHGCPPGGEKVVAITGTRNPYWFEENESVAAWRDSVVKIMDRLAELYDQTTTQVVFRRESIVYLRKD